MFMNEIEINFATRMAYLQPRVVSSQPKSSCGKQSMKVVRLHKDPEYGLGMVITCGNTYDTILHGAFVESVYPGSPADLDGSIKPGDQIMSVNGVDVRNDHFLTVVDLIQYSNGPVDLLIGKNNDYAPDISVFSNKEITEKSFVKSKAWIVGSENTTECMSPDSKIEIDYGKASEGYQLKESMPTRRTCGKKAFSFPLG